MGVILGLGIFYTIYGCLGLMGVQNIPDEYKDKPWTKDYKKMRGISWLLLGIPFLILYIVDHFYQLSFATFILALLIASVPSLYYTNKNEKIYKQKIGKK